MAKRKTLTPKQEDRRHRILSAARDMVADHGYEGMVMSQVAERAGVSPTTLYNLYNTKDQLVMESLRELLMDNARHVAAVSESPGWHYLYQTVLSGANMATDSPAYAEAILVALQRAKAGDELVKLLLEDGGANMQSSLDAMQDNGELQKNVDTQELAFALNGAYWSTFFMWNKGVIKLQKLKRALLTTFLSLLIPSALGHSRNDLERLLSELD